MTFDDILNKQTWCVVLEPRTAVNALVFNGANLNSQNQVTGATPLHSCVQSNKKPAMKRFECAKLLIEAGADIYKCDMFNLTPAQALHADKEKNAAKMDDEEYIHYFFSMIQILNPENGVNNLVMECMDSMDFEGAINALKDVGDVDEIDCKSGTTILIKAMHQLEITFENESNQHLLLSDISRFILEVLKHGANPNLVPSEQGINDMMLNHNQPPIHTACILLSKYYASITEKKDPCRSIQESLENVVRALYKYGATLSSSVIQLMHSAAMKGHLETVKFFIKELHIDVNTPGRQGLTCLHFAARSGKTNVVQWLVETNQVKISITDDRGKTALDAAKANDKHDIVCILQNLSSNH
jgi:ankyrin repeat protein